MYYETFELLSLLFQYQYETAKLSNTKLYNSQWLNNLNKHNKQK